MDTCKGSSRLGAFGHPQKIKAAGFYLIHHVHGSTGLPVRCDCKQTVGRIEVKVCVRVLFVDDPAKLEGKDEEQAASLAVVHPNLDKWSPTGAERTARLQCFGRLARPQRYAHIDF